MIDPFRMSAVPRVRFGRGEAASVGDEAKSLNMTRPMLVADPGLSGRRRARPRDGGSG